MQKLMTKTATAKKFGITPTQLNADKIRYDMGKYAPGAQNKPVELKTDKPVWYEHRRDNYGPFIVLYTTRGEN